jgi:hypothetical protein
MSFPGFAGHRPAFHGGFCVSRWAVLHGRRVPANLPVGRDLTIRCKIENRRYYCAFGRSKAHHRIRAPALNPRAPEAAAEGTCAWRPTRRSIASAPYQPPASSQVTISGDCIGWRLWIEVIDGSQERPVAGSPRHLTLGRAACGRHGGGEGIAWQCDSDVASFDGSPGSAAVMVTWMVVVPIEHRR